MKTGSEAIWNRVEQEILTALRPKLIVFQPRGDFCNFLEWFLIFRKEGLFNEIPHTKQWATASWKSISQEL